MKRTITLVAAGVLSLAVGMQLAANEPIFVRWLVEDDPGDQTIREYWERSLEGQLTTREMVDLGTMLFHRGYPKDAIRIYRQVLNEDPKMYEAWFRIGLVDHRDGRLRNAEQAYERCLKLLTGHGWCNFYMGLLQEQTGHAKKALEYYRRAFKFAPELADPEVNPEVLYSNLQLGARLEHNEAGRFTRDLPMGYLEPATVSETRQKFEPTPIPTPVPAEQSASKAPGDTREEKVLEVKVGTDSESGGTTGTSTGTRSVGKPRPTRFQNRSRPSPTRERPTPRPEKAQTDPSGTTSGGRSLPPGISSVSGEASVEPLWPSDMQPT